MKNKPFVAVMMGSDSDLTQMEVTFAALQTLGVPYEARILSAHRTPELTVEYVNDAKQRGVAVFIAAAGLAAHLAGTIAAHTVCPVIGIPMDAGGLKGIDALLSTVQMPGGTPVACTSIGKAGAKNAAFLAAEILALNDKTIEERLLSIRQEKREALQKANQQLQQQLADRECVAS